MIPTKNKNKLCLSFSGGRTSAFMTQWCLKNLKEEYDMAVVFANTGREREETLIFADQCDKYFGFNMIWVEAVVNVKKKFLSGREVVFEINEWNRIERKLRTKKKLTQGYIDSIITTKTAGTTHKVVTFETANRSGKPFEDVIKKYGMPNVAFPHCSRELKAQAIKSYLNSIGWKNCYTAIGIRADETRRLNWDKARENNLIYPLATMIHTVKSDINKFFQKMPFDLELKSYEGNCDLCFKKGLRKIMTLVNEKPELSDWWRKMENKYESYTPDSRDQSDNNRRFFRDNMSIDEIIEEAKFSFEPAKDESKLIDTQITLWDEHLDTNGGCVESCEAY